MKKFDLAEFPNTAYNPFLETSPNTPSYNCIAWAFGDNTRWYWPDPDDIAYWPENINRSITIDAFIDLYKLIDYEVCENADLQVNIEKIAIFTDKKGLPTHAARQLVNGSWTSKLGHWHDVQHTLESMNNGVYGTATVYMARMRK